MEIISNELFLPVLGIASGILAIAVARSMIRGFQNELPPTIEDSRMELDHTLGDINLYAIETENNRIIVYFEFFPSFETLSRIPVCYKGFEVETRIYDETQSVKIK